MTINLEKDGILLSLAILDQFKHLALDPPDLNFDPCKDLTQESKDRIEEEKILDDVSDDENIKETIEETAEESVTESDIIGGQIKRLHKYQQFIKEFMGPGAVFKRMLVYWLPGAGKTLPVIDLFNFLYNYDSSFVLLGLLPSTLIQSPWWSTVKNWLEMSKYSDMFENIHFIGYDSAVSEKKLEEVLFKIDPYKKFVIFVEEAHVFINGVTNSFKQNTSGKFTKIYNKITEIMKRNEENRLLLLTGTPIVNDPYELSIMFNLLKPGIFPIKEAEFNKLFVTPTGINKSNMNLFLRRISGLVSYYNAIIPNAFARKELQITYCRMSKYQDTGYSFALGEETKLLQRKNSKLFKQYTRQVSNFVFPDIPEKGITSTTRPRPEYLETVSKKDREKQYKERMDFFMNEFILHINNLSIQDKESQTELKTDFEFAKKNNITMEKLFEENQYKSKVFEILYQSSSKMMTMLFNIYSNKGKHVVYSTYVYGEGISIFKIYLKTLGINFLEYSGEVNKHEREENIKIFNNPENNYGDDYSVILISAAGVAGLSLTNIKYMHIMEFYWNMVRIIQFIGRGIRFCSHKDFPIDQRIVIVFGYISKRHDSQTPTTDEKMYESANTHYFNTIEEFHLLLKMGAVDCLLNAPVNQATENFKCMQINEDILIDNPFSPIYKMNIEEDKYSDIGSLNPNTYEVNIETYKVTAIIQLSETQHINQDYYLVDFDSGHVYDYRFHTFIGKLLVNNLNEPVFYDENEEVHIIIRLFTLPLLNQQ